MKMICGGMSPRVKLFVWIAGIGVVLDQWTKYLVVGHLTTAFATPDGNELSCVGRLGRFLSERHPSRGGGIAVFDHFWHFRYVENPGAAWGMFAQTASWFRTPFFLCISIAAMIFIVMYFKRTQPNQGLVRVALALVLGGAIGNLIDRARLGYVIDFIEWHWYDRATWPTFNIADMGISVGVGLLVLDILLHHSVHSEETGAEDSA